MRPGLGAKFLALLRLLKRSPASGLQQADTLCRHTSEVKESRQVSGAAPTKLAGP
jgi:hypothetical protein